MALGIVAYLIPMAAAALILTVAPTGTDAAGVCYGSNAVAGTYAGTVQLVYTTTSYYSYSCGWWGWRRCGGSSTNYHYYTGYTTRYQTVYVQTSFCCTGYTGSPPSCNPVCSTACQQGTCTAPNTCTCNTGWTGSICQTPICSPTCANGGTCTAPNTCSCTSGWTGSTCNTDINECSTSNGGCAQNCHNTAGSYYCSCNTGYSLASNSHSCNDINECSNNNGGCNHICTNIIGSFECSCNTGYELSSDQMTCVDTNECGLNNGGCAQNCTNSIGSYSCSCGAGYNLNSDGHACDDINECVLNTHLCHHICINTIGSYTCDCNVGYMLNSDGLTCSDINECDTNNGGCDQNCHNTNGSYYCTCNTGFLLDEDNHGCSDHDECATSHDNCDQNCHNTHGSFYCTCDNGWRLDSDGHTCNDINECAEDISGCKQICNNTPGSYFCTCYVGFLLDADNHTCNDINECETANGGCSHFCTNNIGSFKCTCRAGYDLADDFLGCDAQPCVPQLIAPQNGSIWCTGDQVTDQNCSFACDAGFTFTGSNLRECLPNNSWTGMKPSCIPKDCQFLENPPNGYVVRNVEIDCGTILTTACEIKCVEGYYINDTTPYYQTCVANQTSGGVYWSAAPVCELILPCHSNPCQHSGRCTDMGLHDYKCDCSGTFYKGENCETGIIRFSNIPLFTVNTTSSVLQITAYPENSIVITFMTSDLVEISPYNVTIKSGFPVAEIQITGLESGIFPISYTITGPSAGDFDEPQSFYALVLEPTSTHPPNKYFNQLGLAVGVLAPGCCMPSGLSYQCLSSPSTVSFSSTCSWSSQGTSDYLSNGIIFVNVGSLQLPLSIAGVDLSVSTELVQNTLPDSHLVCTNCQSSGPSCYHYDFTTNDIVDLLLSRALGNSYLNRVQMLMPTWLRFAINGTTLTPNITFSLLDYSTTLAIGRSVNHIQGCEGLDVNDDGLYSVFRYHGDLTAWVDSVQSDHVLSTMENPICFAVDVCNGSMAPVHITIPASSQEAILSLDQLQGYTRKGWKFSFSEALVSSNRVIPSFITFSLQYWNGVSWFTPTTPDFDLRLEGTVRNLLISNRLWINFRFIGDLFLKANPANEQMQGMLLGEHNLVANMTVQNEVAAMNMRGTVYPVVFSMPDYATTNLPGGAGLKLLYSPDTTDTFFSRVFPLPEGESACPLDVFIKFNNSNDLSWMSFATDCLEFRVSDFRFPPGSTQHRVYLTGSSDRPTTDGLWDGAIVRVYSNLKDSSLPLNRYLSVRQPTSGPAFSAGYWSGGRAEARIFEAEFSLLGTHFTVPADIDEEGLRFNSTVTILGKYRTQISGEVPAGYTWDDVPFTVSGSFEAGPSSFIYGLDEYTQNYVTSKLAQAGERIRIVNMARNITQQHLAIIQARYNEKMSAAIEAALRYQQAVEKVTQAAAVVNSLQQEVDNANQEVLEAQNAVTNICMEQECPTICAPEITCQSCDNPLTFDNWGQYNELRVDRVVDYRTVTSTVRRWEYERQCRIITNIQRWAEVSFGQKCSYVSLPKEVSFEEEEAYFRAVNVSHITAKPKSTSTFLMTQVCCTEKSCGQKFPSILCASENAACQLAQQPAYDALNETHSALVDPLKRLSEANTNLTLAIAEAAVAESNKNITEQDLQLFLPTLNAITQAAATQESNYQQVLAEEQPILDLEPFLSNFSINELVNVLGLTFSVSFQESSPSIIPVTITVSIPLLNETFNLSLTVDLAAPEPILQRAIAERVLSQVGSILASKQALFGKKKRAVEELPPTVQQFERNCATITSLKQYLVQLNTTIDDAVAHLEAARSNISATIRNIRMLTNVFPSNLSNINFTLLENKFGLFGLKDQLSQQVQNSTVVVQLKEIVNSLADVTQNFHDRLDGDIIVHWQAAMGMVNTVSDTACYGFADCLIIVGRLVEELLADTPGEMSATLLSVLPTAKQSLANLSLVTNLTPTQAKMRTAPMLDILKGMETIGYWCSTPPVITKEPEKKVNVDLWQQFSITCHASSNLTLSYSWKKGGFVQTGFTTSTFTKSRAMYSDEGKYQCSVTNVIATTESLYSTVEVFEPPAITLSPSDFTTYEGDDNGAVFVCNATSRPSPSYEWYWSNNGDDWSVVSNSSSNELFLSKPLKEDQGWYRCRAFTDNGLVYSSSARLTILSVSISKLVYSVSFQVDLVQTIETSGSGSDSNTPDTTESIKQALFDAFNKYLGLTTTQIDDIDISLSVNSTAVSFDVFTEHDLQLNETLADIALLAQVNQRNIMEAIPKFWQLLQNTSFRLVAGAGIFAVNINSIDIGNLNYVCPAGTVLRYNNFLCVGCPPGQYQTTLVGGEQLCSECGVGYYQTGDASTSCERCPSRHTNLRNDSRTRDECLALCQPGNFNSTYGVEPCQPCPAWHYQLNYGALSCLPCPERSTLPACIRPTASTPPPGLDRNTIIILSTSIPGAVVIALAVVLVVILILVVVIRSRKKKKHNSSSTAFIPPEQSHIPEANTYSDTHVLINAQTAPSKYNVASTSNEDSWKANPVYMKVEELEEYDPVNKLTASKATHKLDTLEEEDDEEEEEDERVDLI